MAEPVLDVTVVYATPAQQTPIALRLEAGSTVRQAVERSGLLQRFPEISLEEHTVGIFGKICATERPLQDGDRVEIYRPLVADPKDLRRQRAAKSG